MLRWSAQALAQLRHVPPASKKRLRAGLCRIAAGDATGLDVRPLRGSHGLLRLRVGNWRAACRQSKASVDVVRVFHRSDGYDWLDPPKPL